MAKQELSKELALVVERQAETKNLTPTKIEKIAFKYSPFMNEVHTHASDLKALEKGSEQDVEQAAIIRRALSKVCSRVGAQKTEDKKMLLAEQRFYDALHNTVVGAARLVQEEATQIEKHFEIQEKARVEKLQAERLAEVEQYGVDGDYINLADMQEEVWKNFKAGTKASYEQRIKAEQQAKADEEARIKKAEKEAEERRIKEEKERKIEAEKQRKELAAIAARNKKLEAERKAAEAKAKEEAEARAKAEAAAREKQVKAEAEAAALRKQIQEKEAAEAAERKRIEDEAKAKLAEEEKQRKQRELAPDKEKLMNYIYELLAVEVPTFEQKEVKALANKVSMLLDKIVNFVKEQIEKL